MQEDTDCALNWYEGIHFLLGNPAYVMKVIHFLLGNPAYVMKGIHFLRGNLKGIHKSG